MKFIVVAAALVMCSAVSGVFYYRSLITHDVAWYKANQEAMKVKFAACRNNPGLAEHDPDCLNADDAQTQVRADAFMGRAKALPWK